MRQHERTAEESRDIRLEGACLLCGGDLVLRVTAEGVAGSYCNRCRWISRPHIDRLGGGNVRLFHPAAGLA